MVKARIFIEGGSPGEIPDAIFKQSWQKFFVAAGLTGRMPGVVRGTSRDETFDKFKDALSRQNPRRKDFEMLLLLVDSEGPVRDCHSTWQHLNERDNWNQPTEADDDSAYLMVQFMETWFLADRDALRSFFGPQLNENHFREWPNLEAVAKGTVLDALKRATLNCQKPYSKGKVSFELLGRIDPLKVAAACPHAKHLLDSLRTL